MKLQMDKIVFESRDEIDNIENALDTFLKEHSNDKGADTIKRLLELLDVMYMSW